jgi:hypothetical protein
VSAEDIADPLVRMAYQAKRKVDNLQVAVQAAQRDLDFATESLACAVQDVETGRAELSALMAAMTSEQHQELVLAELSVHRAAVLKSKTTLVLTSLFKSAVKQAFVGEPDTLKLHKGDSLLNDLRVVWRR